MATPTETQGVIRSLIPARIDRLPWSPFHTRLVVARRDLGGCADRTAIRDWRTLRPCRQRTSGPQR
jgi:hypothetical protein